MLARVGLEMAWVEAAARGIMVGVLAEAARTLERRIDVTGVRIIVGEMCMYCASCRNVNGMEWRWVQLGCWREVVKATTARQGRSGSSGGSSGSGSGSGGGGQKFTCLVYWSSASSFLSRRMMGSWMGSGVWVGGLGRVDGPARPHKSTKVQIN